MLVSLVFYIIINDHNLIHVSKISMSTAQMSISFHTLISNLLQLSMQHFKTISVHIKQLTYFFFKKDRILPSPSCPIKNDKYPSGLVLRYKKTCHNTLLTRGMTDGTVHVHENYKYIYVIHLNKYSVSLQMFTTENLPKIVQL